MLTDQEIVRRLQTIKFTPVQDRYARRAQSLNSVIVASGLSAQCVYQIINGNRGIGRKSRYRLSKALIALQSERERTDVSPR